MSGIIISHSLFYVGGEQMTIAESLYFIYDGRRSDEMGIINAYMDTGMKEQNFLPEQSIKEESIRGNDTPYLIETERNPFSISLTLLFEDGFDDTKLKEVYRWLNQREYKELYFSSNLDKRYYTMYVGEPKLVHNTLGQGYINIEMRNMDGYYRTPIYSEMFDFSTNPIGGTEIEITNFGSETCSPILTIEKIGSGEIKVVNYSNQGKEFRLINLFDKEIVEIDCLNEDISTNLSLVYHFDDAFGDYPSFVEGVNYIKIYGKCKMRLEYQFKY